MRTQFATEQKIGLGERRSSITSALMAVAADKRGELAVRSHVRQNMELVPRDSVSGSRALAERGAVRKAVLMLPDGNLYDLYAHNTVGGQTPGGNQTAALPNFNETNTTNTNNQSETNMFNNNPKTNVKEKTGETVKIGAGQMAQGTGSGVVDSNRFYSMLLDARAANISVTENMHDVAERLLKGEKENAKLALDQLWALKKSLSDDSTGSSVEALITYYQDKIDVLREREEAIKKVSRDTRALVEEKRKKDEELSVVKSQINNHTSEISELNIKLEALKMKENELVAIERELREKINSKESQIVGGLYDIILHRSEENGETAKLVHEVAAQTARFAALDENYVPESRATEKEVPDIIATDGETYFAPKPAFLEKEPVFEPVVYPKSVVRMGGKVIGEYYHDGNTTDKDARQYIYNGKFLADRMSNGIASLKHRFNQDTHAELIKIADDAASRVNGRRFHFEISTNEILNDKNLKQLASDLRRRAWDDAEKFAVKLSAKIEALGSNYNAMLQEQMERHTRRV